MCSYLLCSTYSIEANDDAGSCSNDLSNCCFYPKKQIQASFSSILKNPRSASIKTKHKSEPTETAPHYPVYQEGPFDEAEIEDQVSGVWFSLSLRLHGLGGGLPSRRDSTLGPRIRQRPPPPQIWTSPTPEEL